MPKVSVIIITYNRAKLLSLAIESVLKQTFQDFEIVVVDDASKDNTNGVVSSFNDKRIKYIRHEVNKRESAARNTGIMNSNGQYIAFLDDDDEWLPDKLRMQVDLMESSSSIIGGVYTGLYKVDGANEKIEGQVIPIKKGNIFNDMFTENWVGTPSTVLLRRECFEKLGVFDENITYGPDYDMWLRISKEFHFEYIKEPLVKYYIHGNRLTANYGLVIRGLEAILEKHGQLLALNRKSYSNFYLILGVRYCYFGDVKKGREAFLKAIRAYPFEIRHYFNYGLSLLGPGAFKKLKGTKEKLVDSLKISEI